MKHFIKQITPVRVERVLRKSYISFIERIRFSIVTLQGRLHVDLYSCLLPKYLQCLAHERDTDKSVT